MTLGTLRYILWGLVAVAAAALIFLLARPAPELPAPSVTELPRTAAFGGPLSSEKSDPVALAKLKRIVS